MSKEKDIINSWHTNARNWINIIERNGIESRRLVTNEAIINAVCSAKPRSVLDIGCGEGWLSAKLAEKGIAVTGIDVIPELIEKAKQKVTGDFFVASYEDMTAHTIRFTDLFDAAVINFALIGKESAEQLLHSLPSYLIAGGKLFIQTLHPYHRKAINDYTSGWKTDSWDGLGDEFTQPYEWYFRTLEDWVQLLKGAGFNEVIVHTTKHPVTGAELSVIFECSR